MEIKCKMCGINGEQAKSYSEMCSRCEFEFNTIKNSINEKTKAIQKSGEKSYV